MFIKLYWLLISPKKRNTTEEGKMAELPMEVPLLTIATNKRENVHPHFHSHYEILTPRYCQPPKCLIETFLACESIGLACFAKNLQLTGKKLTLLKNLNQGEVSNT